MSPFRFPATLQAEGFVWHLIYDPDGANTVLPNLQQAKLLNVFGQWVQVPTGSGEPGKVFMAVVDLSFPAVNTPSYRKPAQYVRGFRLYPNQVDPSTAPPQEMAMYIREIEPPSNVAQEFIDAVLGMSAAEQSKQNPDTEWTRILSSASSSAVPTGPSPSCSNKKEISINPAVEPIDG